MPAPERRVAEQAVATVDALQVLARDLARTQGVLIATAGRRFLKRALLRVVLAHSHDASPEAGSTTSAMIWSKRVEETSDPSRRNCRPCASVSSRSRFSQGHSPPDAVASAATVHRRRDAPVVASCPRRRRHGHRPLDSTCVPRRDEAERPQRVGRGDRSGRTPRAHQAIPGLAGPRGSLMALAPLMGGRHQRALSRFGA